MHYHGCGGLGQLIDMCSDESEVKFSYGRLCEDGTIADVEEFLAKNEDLPLETLNYGFKSACENNRTEIIDLLVHNNIHDWNSGLYGACYGKHFELAKVLIQQHGARCSEHLLIKCCHLGYTEAVEFVLGYGAISYCEEGLRYACEYGYLQIIEMLVQKSYSEFQLFNNWINIITTASIHGHIDVIKYVLSQCPYIQTLDLSYALYEAFCKDAWNLEENMNIIKLLIDSVSFDRNKKGSIINLKLGWKYVLTETKHITYEVVRLVTPKCNTVEYNSFVKRIGRKTNNIMIRYMYCMVTSKKPLTDIGFNKLLRKHPPYVLLLGKYFAAAPTTPTTPTTTPTTATKARKNRKKRGKSRKSRKNTEIFAKNKTNQIKRLPIELLRHLYDFWRPNAQFKN